MASSRKTYFLTPSWDITPGEVRLGSVIADIRSPQNPLSSTNLVDSIDTCIYTQDSPTSGAVGTSATRTAGLFATFLQNVTLGGDVSYSRSSTSATEYSCGSMTTSRFQPSSSYLEKVASDQVVQNYLRISGLGAKVFIVNGLKTVSSTTITTSNETRTETKLTLGIEIPAAQVNVGPKTTFAGTKNDSQTTHIEGPIVFAFQVLKARIGRKGDMKTKDYVHGAVLGAREFEDYVLFGDGDDLNSEELDDYDLVKSQGRDEETGDACDVILESEQTETSG